MSRAVLLALVLLAGCAARGPAADTARPLGSEGASKQSRPAAARLACDVPTDCVVQPRTCCGQCGAAVPGNAVAVSARWLEARRAAGLPTCEGGTGCPECYEETSPALVATCRDHRCRLVDLGRSPITACETDADCALTHSGCCDCGSPGPIAVRRGRERAYRRLICGAGPVSCLACIGPPLSGSASCVSGHCVAVPPGP